MKGSTGRRPKLTEAEVRAILAWHRSRRTNAQIARQYGISKATLGNILRTGGAYKSASPERREQLVRERRARLARLRALALM